MSDVPLEAARVRASPARLDPWRRRLGLEPLDCWFAGLRALALTTGLAWWALARDDTHAPRLAILALFFAVSVGLYLVNVLYPGRIATLYRLALIFDLGIVFFLVRITGGFASDLYLAFILLIALHAFYFGLVTGLSTAAAAIGLYAVSGDWPPPMPGVALRMGSFALVGLCMGLVAEEARRQREAMEQQRERLVRSDRLATVGELAAGLAHELRNPLAGIGGVLHVLDGQLPTGDGRRPLVAEVQAQIARMDRTLTDLLQHARPAAPRMVPLDINGLLEESLRFFPRGNVEIVRQFDESLPPLLGDPNLLHQAVLNMLVNARQAMPQGGRLTLRTMRARGEVDAVRVLVSDTGVGIPGRHLGRIFQPLFTTKTQGTGLGLAIAARVVEQHGGHITVDSAPGRGTTFAIVVPVRSHAGLERSDAHAVPRAGR